MMTKRTFQRIVEEVFNNGHEPCGDKPGTCRFCGLLRIDWKATECVYLHKRIESARKNKI